MAINFISSKDSDETRTMHTKSNNVIDFPSQGKDWKKFELNNKSIALNILHVPYNTKDMHICQNII